MIELLVVMAIIAILAGLLLSAAEPIRKQRMITQTNTIIRMLKGSLETTAAGQGGTISAVEHPLAASAVPRAEFLRDTTWAVLDTSNPALRVQDITWVAAANQGQILQRTDVYQGGGTIGSAKLPLIYGLRRGEIGILGGASDAISSYRQLPHKDTQYWDASNNRLRTPYDATIYPNGTTLVAPALEAGQTIESSSRHVLNYVLGSAAGKELVDLKAVYDESTGTLLDNDRVRQDSADTSERSSWSSGRLRCSDGKWRRYRLRGSGLYDAWGNEILVSASPRGSLRITSAGPDGVFVWHPGGDGIYQTQAYANPRVATPSGDDRNGLKDNVGDDLMRDEP